MKRISFLIAAMAATATAPAVAQQDPGRMFMINAVTPGVVSYSGEGTAQFNNSSTTSNAFSVGSSSNFGVNASVSSTNDYLVDANALFKLADSSQLQQTIGTSSSAANTQAASESSAMAADTVANSAAQTEFGDDWSDFQARQGVSPVTGTAALQTGIENPTGGAEIKTESAYLAAKKEFTQSTRNEVFSDFATTANNSSASASGGQGIIEGNFLTTNSSSNKIGASAASSAGNTVTAESEANKAFGTTYSDYIATFTSYAGSDGKITGSGEISAAKAAGIAFNATTGDALLEGSATDQATTDWTDEKNKKRDDVFSELQNSAASQGSAESASEAVVQVKGVGSITTLNASGDSAFNVDVATRLRNSVPETNGTANGSAGGNLATSSFANQSNTQSASAFMQAFGADTVTLNKAGDGSLASVTTNGRFNVTVDANPGFSSAVTGGSVIGDQTAVNTTAALEALKVLVP
jgi:hypothetical protein